MLRPQSKSAYPFYLVFFMGLILSGPAAADMLVTSEYQLTGAGADETTPTVGNDGVSDLVVYTVMDPTTYAGDIFYRRLDTNGAPDGPAVPVATGPTDDRLNDVSGDYIVYTAFESPQSNIGVIMLYQISTGNLCSIGDPRVCYTPRIHGYNLVWLESGGLGSLVYLLAFTPGSCPSVADAELLGDTYLPTDDLEIGDRFVVWVEHSGAQDDIHVYDLAYGVSNLITNTLTVNESAPITSGPWVAWQAVDEGASVSRIEAVNMRTLEERVITDDSSINVHPSMDGDLIAWESDRNGNLDVFVYRISTAETFQVTTDSAHQIYSSVHGDVIAYVDNRGSDLDIYVSKIVTCVWYVRTDGSDSNTGTSWDDAFQTIQKAIDVAQEFDEIWVKEGTYNTSAFVWKPVRIYGGFAGTETKRDERDWKENVTIVDGQGVRLGCFGFDANAVVDGLTITGGFNTQAEGGGMLIGGEMLDISVTITNCIFYENFALGGGAIFCSQRTRSVITNCIFYGNSADRGGAIYAYHDSSPTITNCTFYGNSADNGGAIYDEESSTTITNCILWGNNAPEEIYSSGTDISVTYCNVEGGYPGEGNINEDPLFIDPGNGDFHIQVRSPCVDRGTNSAPEIPDIDFEGDPRILDGDNDSNAVVDMGADEYSWSADNDNDGVLNSEEMGPFGDDPDYDGNGDSIPDYLQDNVASLHTYDGVSYVTIASPSGTTLSDVQAVDNPSPADAPAGVEFPYGFFEFTINNVGIGGATYVIIYLPGPAPSTYYKHGPTPGDPSNHWYEFIYDVQTQTGAAPSGNTIILYFVDGERGDYDLVQNGTVVEPGGPASILFIPVAIDIKPGSDPNSINLGSQGNVPVAIFSTADFDATTVDPVTVTLAGASVRLKGKGTPMASFEDVNGDGLMDIVVHVDTTALELSAGDTEAVLEGETFDGVCIRGVDTVRIINE